MNYDFKNITFIGKDMNVYKDISALEIISWLKDNHYTNTIKELFNTTSLDKIFNTYSANDIKIKIGKYILNQELGGKKENGI